MRSIFTNLPLIRVPVGAFVYGAIRDNCSRDDGI